MSVADEIIIEGCKKGKRHAQNKLYKKYSSVLLGICLRYARNKDEAEDILQDGFIKIFTHIKNFRGDGSFEGWLKRIMVNTAITHNKQNLKHQYQTDIDQIEETQVLNNDTEQEVAEVKIPQSKLMEIIQNLPEGYRMVFNLYVFEEFTHKDIADLLGISVNTSKSQLSKARRLLQTRITEFSGNKQIAIS